MSEGSEGEEELEFSPRDCTKRGMPPQEDSTCEERGYWQGSPPRKDDPSGKLVKRLVRNSGRLKERSGTEHSSGRVSLP